MTLSLCSMRYTLALFLLVFTCGVSQADDTDIFFNDGGLGSSSLTPNLLLILDTSASMTNPIEDDDNANPPSRISVLREAVKDIIAGVPNINVGLMRFTGGEGGPVLFPITAIDAPVGDLPSEFDGASSAVINDPLNDAVQELKENAVRLNDAALPAGLVSIPGDVVSGGGVSVDVGRDSEEVVKSGGIGGNSGPVGRNILGSSDLDFNADVHSAISFNNTGIPRNANITLAELDLYVSSADGGAVTMAICAVDEDDPFPLPGQSFRITSALANCTDNTVEWALPAYSSGAQRKITHSILPIIEELVQRGCDEPGVSTNTAGCTLGTPNFGSNNSGLSRTIVLLFRHVSGNGNRAICTEEAAMNQNQQKCRDRGAVLRVNWDGAAEEAEDVDHIVGLRFENVRIPQSAAVNAANLIFTPSSDQSEPARIRIRAENASNSAGFNNNINNISGRPLTAAEVIWDNPVWTDNEPASIDLRALVQEVVNQADWCGGNAMTFVIEAEGGAREFVSADTSPAQSARLDYDYDPSSTGCRGEVEYTHIAEPNDDARLDESNSNTRVRLSGPLNVDRDNTLALRFQEVGIPADAIVESANITFKSNAISPGLAGSLNVAGELSSDAAAYTNTPNSIRFRTETQAQVTWQPGTWLKGNTYETEDLSAIVQEIVDQGGWEAGNTMGFLITASGPIQRVAESYESDFAGRPRLHIRYTTREATTPKTVRTRLLEIVDELSAADSTPIVETLFEAARYWRGGAVKYGREKSSDRARTHLSHPASYCDAPGSCNGANINATNPFPTDEFGVEREPGCMGDRRTCGRRILGAPRYISPFSSSLDCQKNYQVLLTDGFANDLGTPLGNLNNLNVLDEIKYEFLDGVDCATENGAGDAYSPADQCGVDLAGALFENDQVDTLANDQNVTTYTVAFNLDSPAPVQFLRDMAEKGSGSTQGFRSANTATELLQVFSEIFAEVVDEPTAFVAPALATNQFASLETRDVLYFGMFTPAFSQRWFGNVKKYRLCVDPDADGEPDSGDECTLGDVLDATGNSALDARGQIRETARSLWSVGEDGAETTEGGAGQRLDDYRDRVIYTETTANNAPPPVDTNLATAPGFRITHNNWGSGNLAPVRQRVCPTPSTQADSDCAERMLWMLGKVSDTDGATDPSDTTHWSIFDVLHSQPVVVTYGGADLRDATGNEGTDGVIETFYDKIFFGTNDGGLHMLNAETGEEEWVFMPAAMLDQQPDIFDNASGPHIYGLDLTATLRVFDANNDGIIDPNPEDDALSDFVHIYIGNRRGGRFLYALDITPNSVITNNRGGAGEPSLIQPKFLWRIDGGSEGYERLGQTWSEPRLATIRLRSAGTGPGGADEFISKEVLIMGGGYDPDLDERFGGATNEGNGIFIVDADTGEKLLVISGTDVDSTDIHIPDMRHAFAASLIVFDNDGDGFDDRIYAADTGGQIFRVDLGLDIAADGGIATNASINEGKTVIGRLAAISDAANVADQRRFMTEPVVVQVRDQAFSDASNGEYDYVFIGSGDVTNPLDLAPSIPAGAHVRDRFYAFRDRTVGRMSARDEDHLAVGYPAKSGGGSDGNNLTSGEPINHDDVGDLIDVSNEVLDSENTTHLSSTGWYIDLTEADGANGEKVVREARVIAGQLLFSSYQPYSGEPADSCAANIGRSRGFRMDILSAAAVTDEDEDGALEPVADRSYIAGAGIVSESGAIFSEHGIVVLQSSGAGFTGEMISAGNQTFKSYWTD